MAHVLIYESATSHQHFVHCAVKVNSEIDIIELALSHVTMVDGVIRPCNVKI